MNNVFLKVNKKYYEKLKPLEILIMSQIEEFNNNGCECYLTNKQFAKMFCVSEPTVDSALNKLEKLKYIKRITSVETSKGCANRVRKLVALTTEKKPFNWSF